MSAAALVTSASWECPVCNQRGDLHEAKCFVLELSREVAAAEARVAALVSERDAALTSDVQQLISRLRTAAPVYLLRPASPEDLWLAANVIERAYADAATAETNAQAALERAEALVSERDALQREREQWGYSPTLKAERDAAEARVDEEREIGRILVRGQMTLQARVDELTAENAALRDDLREIVRESYNLITQGESPTQRRQPSAQKIYDLARAALGSTTPAYSSAALESEIADAAIEARENKPSAGAE